MADSAPITFLPSHRLQRHNILRKSQWPADTMESIVSAQIDRYTAGCCTELI
jgi:hypothetical protein